MVEQGKLSGGRCIIPCCVLFAITNIGVPAPLAYFISGAIYSDLYED